MCQSTLNELPLPAPDKHGWPWYSDQAWKPDVLLDEANWPRVTIVTPSFNQGVYLEETIRSVLLQGYPNLEYFVIDGGSTDNSVEIIKKYEPWITGWVSERDRGQSHAINKGFELATGDWLGWLNSDDCYAPYGLFRLIAAGLSGDANFVYGSSVHFESQGMVFPVPLRKDLTILAYSPRQIRLIDLIDQPASLWTRKLFEQIGPLREDMHYAFDWDFFIRTSSFARPALCPEVTAVYRYHNVNKTGSGGLERLQEIMKIFEAYLPQEYRTRFFRIRPLISVLIRFSMTNQRARGLVRFFSRVVLFLVNRSGLLSLSGLPKEVWEMLTVYRGPGIFRGSKVPLVNFKYGDSSTSSVAEALAQFPPIKKDEAR